LRARNIFAVNAAASLDHARRASSASPVIDHFGCRLWKRIMKSRWLVLALLLATRLECGPAIAQRIDFEGSHKRFEDLYAAADYKAALAEAQRTEAAAKRAGTNNIAYVLALNDLGRAHQALGQYGTAATMFNQAIATLRQAVLQKQIAPEDPRLRQIIANLATVYLLQGRHDDAEKLYNEALQIAVKASGPASSEVAMLTGNLAEVAKQQRRYAQAEALYQRALNLAEKAKGPSSLLVALILNNLTKVYEELGRFNEAVDANKRALEVYERTLGPDHPDVAVSLNNLAHVYERIGRYAQSDELYQRAIAILERSLAPNHPNLATALLNLASVYADEERLDEAEALYKRALGIREATFGPNHLQVATVLNNLAQIYEIQGRYKDVEAFSKRALAIVSKELGPNSPDTAKVIRKLGVAYDGLGRPAEAEAHLKRALDIYSKELGPNHHYVALVLSNQGRLLERQGRYAEAEQAYKRALAISETTRGSNHPQVARTLNDLALLSIARGDARNAVALSRRATAAVIAHGALGEGSGGQVREIVRRSGPFAGYVASLAAAARAGIDTSSALGSEAFEAAQWASHSSAAAAVQQLSTRFSTSNDVLAALVRQSQDLAALWRDQDKALVEALSKPRGDASQTDNIRRQMADTERKLAAVAAQLQREFPDYAALANPKPLKLEAAQKLLGPDEALVFFLTGDKASYVFALTRDGFAWDTIPSGKDDLVGKIAAFRRGLKNVPRRGEPTMVEFDIELAHRMFGLLLGPVDALIKDKGHLLVVPSGPLTAMPFHVLVTEQPAVPMPQRLGERVAPFRNAAWLIKRQAISVLPAVASLQTLRSSARTKADAKPMIGFGDPDFDVKPVQEDKNEHQPVRSRGTPGAYGDYWRGQGVDRAALATLEFLPDTAVELRAIAQAVGASEADIFLRSAATVTAVKAAPLSDYRVVYFATHGLVAGEIGGLGEPSLALSLPAKPTDDDDGLLRASQVAQLKLNADWVVLSACNTIAGDKPGAEALSGLARAFFYAGARALLVTHWDVETKSAVRLTTAAFAALKAEPMLGRAEAMRRSMLALLHDVSSPLNAFPAVWGPFVVVGEGGAADVAVREPSPEKPR
jgi:CHAT domain-containing protein/tetratricopeptide (TPR) repeat protein